MIVVFGITAVVMAVGAISELLIGPETGLKSLEVTSREEVKSR